MDYKSSDYIMDKARQLRLQNPDSQITPQQLKEAIIADQHQQEPRAIPVQLDDSNLDNAVHSNNTDTQDILDAQQNKKEQQASVANVAKQQVANLFSGILPDELPQASNNETPLMLQGVYNNTQDTAPKQEQESEKLPSQINSQAQQSAPKITTQQRDEATIPANAMKDWSKDDELAAAQQKASNANFLNTLLAAGGRLGTSIAQMGSTNKIENGYEDLYNKNIKDSNAPVESLLQKRQQLDVLMKQADEKEKQDPTSDTSLAAKQLYAMYTKKEAPKSATAHSLEKVLPLLEAKYKADLIHEDNMNKAETLKMQKSMMGDQKQQQELDKFSEKITGNARGAEQLKQLNSRMDGVGRAMALINGHTDALTGKTKISPQEFTELNMELARILTGSGVVHHETLQNLDPQTGPRYTAQLIQRVTGQPVDINNLGKSIERLKHNLTNQYSKSEDQLKSYGNTMARGNEQKAQMVEQFVKQKRELNGISSDSEGLKTVVSPDGRQVKATADQVKQMLAENPNLKVINE